MEEAKILLQREIDKMEKRLENYKTIAETAKLEWERDVAEVASLEIRLGGLRVALHRLETTDGEDN